MGEIFDIVGAGPGIDDAGDIRLLLEIELRVARDAGGEIGRQRDGFVQGIGVQRLGVAQSRGHGLDAGADHVVERVLRGQAPAGGLRVRAQRQRLQVLGLNCLTSLAQSTRAARILAISMKWFMPIAQKKEMRGAKSSTRKAGLNAGAQVFDAVGERIGQLDVGGGPGLLHVIAADADAVELRHVLRAVAEDVADDAHRRRGRIDVGVADHELLENVVLNGSAQLFRRHALLFGGHDVEGHDRQHRAVHGHRHRHLIERDLVEEDLHVEDRVDGHAGFAHIAGHAFVIAVVAAMRGQIEGHRETFLPGGKIAAVKGVGLFGRGEAGILANRPRPHARTSSSTGRAETAECRRRIQVLMPSSALRVKIRRNLDVFGSGPTVWRAARPGCCAGRTRSVINFREIWTHHYSVTPSRFCQVERTSSALLRTWMKSATPSALS